jgi:hypothetical protein
MADAFTCHLDWIEKAHEQCFIASSVTTRVSIEPRFLRTD